MNLTTSENTGLLETTAAPSPVSQTQAISSHRAPLSLPEEPVAVIEPSVGWVPVDLRGLWAYRELFYFLIWRDLKVRYKQTIIGLAWVVMQPVLTTLIFTIFFGRLVNVPSDGIPYPLFIFAGLLAWGFFSGAVLNSSQSLVGNSHLITKVYFPRLLIPAAAIGARLVDFAITSVILAVLMLYHRVPVTPSILMLAPLVVITSLLSLGFGLWTSALNAKYRDVGIALPVLIQLWMYVSPVAYPSSLIPAQWRWLYSLNPMTGIIEGFRASLFSREFDWWALAVSAVFTSALLIYSSYAFRRMERSLADII